MALVACPATWQERALWLRTVSIRILAVPMDHSHEVLTLVFRSRRSFGRQLGVAWTTNSAFPKRQARCLLRIRRNEAQQSDSLDPQLTMATPDGRGKDALVTPDACGASPGRQAKHVPGAYCRRKRERGCLPLLECKVAIAPVQWPWQGGMRVR